MCAVHLNDSLSHRQYLLGAPLVTHLALCAADLLTP